MKSGRAPFMFPMTRFISIDLQTGSVENGISKLANTSREIGRLVRINDNGLKRADF
jgi:hypothetical protein